MEEVFIASACRTPIGKYRGVFKSLSAIELGALAVREAVSRADLLPEQIDEVILGNVVSAGLGQAPARQAALKAGLPHSISALTVNKVCGSSLKAVMLAAQAIRCGDSDIVVAGGMEAMSSCPHLLPHSRDGLGYGDASLVDSLLHDGLMDAYYHFPMGMTAELVAEKYNISRQAQDAFALGSYQKALTAQAQGKFSKEIFAVEAQDAKAQKRLVNEDEAPKAAPLEKMPALKPAFKENGSVTAGNASSLSDGAAALVLVGERKLKELKLKPLARVVAYDQGSLDPKWVMMAPQCAVEKLRRRGLYKVSDIDLFEINEAFSAATLALIQEMGLPPEKVNVHGGAVALGHPLGATGARLLTTLLYALEERNLRRGLATLCIGGGEAVALLVER